MVSAFRIYGKGQGGTLPVKDEAYGVRAVMFAGFRKSRGFGRSFCQQVGNLALQASAKFRRSVVMV
jgi:hypothetical protein